MHRHVFLQIVYTFGNHEEYFQTRDDATCKMGFSPLQNCTSSIHILIAYESFTDIIDKYVLIGESTEVESCGFPSMLGSIYLMH